MSLYYFEIHYCGSKFLMKSYLLTRLFCVILRNLRANTFLVKPKKVSQNIDYQVIFVTKKMSIQKKIYG